MKTLSIPSLTKRTFFMLSLVVLLCASTVLAQASGSSARGTKPLTINCFTSYAASTGFTKTLIDVAGKYAETHPGFTFTPEIISDGNAYLQKLKIYASSNALPDWFFADPDTFLLGLRDKGILTNIGDLINEFGLRERIANITLKYPSFDDGSLYLLGLGANTEYFWYHPSLFQKAGVKPPKTFDEFFAVCETLKQKNITPLVASKEGYYPLMRFAAMIPFRMTGNDFINNARLGKVKFSSDVGLAAGNFVKRLAGYFQEGWAGIDISSSIAFFMSGQCAMDYSTTSLGLTYFCNDKQQLKDDLAYFTLPTVGPKDASAATDYFANPGKGIAMLKTSISDTMKSYVKYVIDNYGDFAIKNKFISGLKPHSFEGLSDFYKEMYDNFSKVRVFAAVWDVRLDTSSNEVMKREITNLALGIITPEEWAKRVDDAIAQYAPAAFNLKN